MLRILFLAILMLSTPWLNMLAGVQINTLSGLWFGIALGIVYCGLPEWPKAVPEDNGTT